MLSREERLGFLESTLPEEAYMLIEELYNEQAQEIEQLKNELERVKDDKDLFAGLFIKQQLGS